MGLSPRRRSTTCRTPRPRYRPIGWPRCRQPPRSTASWRTRPRRRSSRRAAERSCPRWWSPGRWWGRTSGSVAAGAVEVLEAVVSEEPDGAAGVVPPLGSADVAPDVDPPTDAGAAPDVGTVDVGLLAAPPPAPDAAPGPLVLDVPGVESAAAAAPGEVTGVLDGAEAGLPTGVAVTVTGTPGRGPAGPRGRPHPGQRGRRRQQPVAGLTRHRTRVGHRLRRCGWSSPRRWRWRPR